MAMVIGPSFMCVFLATQKKDYPKTPKPGAWLPKKTRSELYLTDFWIAKTALKANVRNAQLDTILQVIFVGSSRL